MIIIYSTRRAILDEIDGLPNPFKQMIIDLKQFANECEEISIADPDYQGFRIPEKVFRKYVNMKGYDYWEQLFLIADACIASTFPSSSLSGVFLAIHADASVLGANVPETLPQATYTDEELNIQHRTFSDWYPDGVKTLPENKVLLLTNVAGERLSDNQMIALKAFADNNPQYAIEWCNKEMYEALT
ncbi:MAG: hypothetical protein CL843_09525 [Crocinitomicaceae bacterium]|nr:hypothetical protein [Crocinitomicaceae bacterium]|tara:strand:- start:567 stop:1127 length:561 start_codon:yes stop_codon:yes gene_type:complete